MSFSKKNRPAAGQSQKCAARSYCVDLVSRNVFWAAIDGGGALIRDSTVPPWPLLKHDMPKNRQKTRIRESLVETGKLKNMLKLSIYA